jgi:hypothetical protein
MRFQRDFYIPKGSAKVSSKSSSAVAYVYERGGKPCAVGFFGKADKPAFTYSFKDAARRALFVGEWFQKMDSCQARKDKQLAERREKMAKPQEQLKVGDVLRCSWGYDQTNIDYFEVTKLVGKRTVEIRKIACESVDTSFMQGQSVPAKGEYLGEPMRKQVSENGSVRIYSFASAYKMEPVMVAGVPVGYRASSWTAYA